MRRVPRLLRLLVLPTVLGVAWLARDRVGYDPTPWLLDLTTLEDSLAAGYANLDDMVRLGVVDPAGLHRLTDSLIRAANSRQKAATALRQFAATFRDGHLHVRRPTPALVQWLEDRVTGRTPELPLRSASGLDGCRALGYRDGDSPSMLSMAPGWRSVSEHPGALGATLPIGGQTVGVLRIASFGVDRHLHACQQAWPGATRLGQGERCDETCQEALWRLTADSILVGHRRTLAALRTAGATVLVVDVTGNGGGNDWVSAASRQVTAVPLRGHYAAGVRHPHHLTPVTEARTRLSAIRASVHDDKWGGVLDSALLRIAAHEMELTARCDRRTIWQGDPAPCPGLAAHGFTTGWVDYLPPHARELPGASVMFTPFAFAYTEGSWDGPVVVLVDHHTASASEDFVVTLMDNGAATIVGERTWGAGCGYTNGGMGFRLPHSGLEVRMPDCARIRRTGQNEVAGVEPDVHVGWESSDPAIERVQKAVAGIENVVRSEK